MWTAFHPSSKVACQIQIAIKCWEGTRCWTRSLQQRWGTPSCLLQRQLPAGCVFLCYWGPGWNSDQFWVAEDTNSGQRFSYALYYIHISATTSCSMRLQVSPQFPKYKTHHPKCISTGVCPLAKHWFMALLLWPQCVLSIQCFLHRSCCCRRLFQTTSSTATRKRSNSTLAPSASLHQHHTANQVRELFQIRNFEPACSQSDPFRNAKRCWEERGTAVPHPRCPYMCPWPHTGAAGPAASSRCCQWYQHGAAQHGHCIQIPDFFVYGAPSKTVHG